MFEDQVNALLQKVLEEYPELFLIDFQISADKKINIVLDGDTEVKVKDCVAISRYIEHSLDKEQEDFSISVSSAGVGVGLLHHRQYVKNIGRLIAVQTKDNDIEGILKAATSQEITLSWKERVPKQIGKGKITVQKKHSIPYSDIIEAKVKIVFQ